MLTFYIKNCIVSFSRKIKLIKRVQQSVSNTRPIAHYTKACLKTMKLDTPQFRSIFTPELKVLIDIFERHHYELRVAGGAVRDILIGEDPKDLDFATTATPPEMKYMFNKENIRMINDNGESHGTITCRINDKENFEVTTLRIDVVSDGRHADVEFTKDWQLDAERRDLTINSMFLGLDGTLYDYYNGRDDLDKRHVRFVGDPVARIQEDYLRILRYFRFFGRITLLPNAHDDATLRAIRENTEGLAKISGERIWVEVKKIVAGQHVDSILRVMDELGVTKYIGFPTTINLNELERVWKDSGDLKPLPMTLIASLLNTDEEMYALLKRVKMSNDELQQGLFIIQHRKDDFGHDSLGICQDLLCDTPGNAEKSKEKVIELLKYCNLRETIGLMTDWAPPKFPVSGYRLHERGIPKGPKFAIVLKYLRQKWKESRYSLGENELLEFVEEAKKSK